MFDNDLMLVSIDDASWPPYDPPTVDQPVKLELITDVDGTVGLADQYGAIAIVQCTPDLSLSSAGTYFNLKGMGMSATAGEVSTTFSNTVPAGNYPGVYLADWDMTVLKQLTLTDGSGNVLDSSFSLIGMISDTEWVCLYCNVTYPDTLVVKLKVKTKEEIASGA